MSYRQHILKDLSSDLLKYALLMNLKIAPFLQDLGYGSTFNSSVILAILEQVQIYPSNASMRITAPEVGAVLGMMAKTHSQLNDNPTLHALTSGILDENSLALLDQMQTWNLELFFPLMKKLVSFLYYYIITMLIILYIFLATMLCILIAFIIRIQTWTGHKSFCAWIILIPHFMTLIL